VVQLNQGFAKLLGQFAVRREINFIVLENQLVDKSLEKIVDVVAAEVRVTVGGKNLKNVAFGGGDELEDGNVKGTASEIVDGDFAALLFVQAVGEIRGSWFVDEAENFEAGNFASVLGGLGLGIVEIRGTGENSAAYWL